MEEDLKRIATRIRAWRDEAGLTLQQLGDRSNVSASTIHKIENLQTVPTIAVLLKIANGLGRRPSELLAEVDDGPQAAVLTASDRKSFRVGTEARIEQLAAMIPRSRIDVWRAELGPDQGTPRENEDWQWNGELILLVESGVIECDIDGELYKVAAGDSIHFESSVPHRWSARGPESATVLVFALLPDRLQSELLSRLAKSSGFQRIE